MIIKPLDEYDNKGWFDHKSRLVGTRVNTIVLHASAGGSLSGAVTTLRKRGYGYHYILDKDGTVWKGAPISSSVAHAGISTGPQGASCNRYSIGVCAINLNDGVHPWTKAQLDALVWLLPQLKPGMDEYKWLCTHYAITVRPGGSARKTDPRLVDVPGIALATGLTPWKPAYANKYAL